MLRVMGWRVLKICVLCIVALILYGIGNWAYISARNYQGYCSGSGTMNNVKLTTKERLDIAVARYLQNQTLMDLNEIEIVENGNRRESDYLEELQKTFTLVPYSSEVEFYQVNPDCCKRTWSMVEGDQFGFWERTEGSGNGMFIFSHKIRYSSKDGGVKEIDSTNTYLAVNNCGYPTYRFYH